MTKSLGFIHLKDVVDAECQALVYIYVQFS